MLFRLFLPLLALMFVAAAKKPPAFNIRFHLQASEADGEPFVTRLPIHDGRGPAFIKKVPEITEHDIVAIFPFTAADGTYGCTLKLTVHGRISLDSTSVEARGRVLVCIINGRVVTAMMIDKRVSDGILTVPSGLTASDVDQLEMKYRMIGQPGGKPKPPPKKQRRNSREG
ncbi:MAG TPA: hypothetical protein VNQ90_17305 [Chthoniobacteraceae bacterium]|nr:hypothetical protein [Chthoniobacteraceae bacterium]